jgi:hypothetical protein
MFLGEVAVLNDRYNEKNASVASINSLNRDKERFRCLQMPGFMCCSSILMGIYAFYSCLYIPFFRSAVFVIQLDKSYILFSK